MVVKRCVIIGCKTSTNDKVGLFHFPTKVELRERWLDSIRNGLPREFDSNNLKSKLVCGCHFPASSIYQAGNMRKLVNGAIPKRIPFRIVERAKVTKANELVSLRAKVKRLENQLLKLRTDPDPSFIFTHRSKLKKYMDEDSYTLFDSCVLNFTKRPHGRRHSYQTKKLANKIYHQSKQAFRMIQPIFALPSFRTIDRFSSDDFSVTGISKDTELTLRRHATKLAESDKYCVISFDETDIKPGFTYLPRRDVVCGYVDMGKHGRLAREAKGTLVFGLRGINERWKQVICYYFVAKTGFTAIHLKRIFEDILGTVFNAGYNVVASVCDGDGKNRSLCSALNVDPNNSQFQFEGKIIHFLFDVPHILKLIRNHCMTKKVFVKIGEHEGTFEWNDVLMHLEPMVSSNGILKQCYKLTKKHLNPVGYEKMKVRYATQMFSHTVGTSFIFAAEILKVRPEKNLLIGHLFKSLDKLFDILNSSSLSQQRGKPWKTALRKDDDNTDYLKYFLELIENKYFFFVSENSTAEELVPNNGVFCIEMLAQTIRGILSLSAYLFDRDIKHLCTRRLNQDILENFFAQVKRSGSHITTSHFRAHFRSSRILFMEALPDGANCEPDEDIPLFLEGSEPSEMESDSCSAVTESSPEAELADYFAAFNPELNEARNELSTFFSTFSVDDVGEDHGVLTYASMYNTDKAGLNSYIAGYLLKKIKDRKVCCDECLRATSSVVALAEHELIRLREYNPELTLSLNCPSKSFADLVKVLSDLLEENVPQVVAVVGVKFTLFRILWRQDYSFIPVCHREGIKLEIMHRLVNMFLGKHLKDLKQELNHRPIKSFR